MVEKAHLEQHKHEHDSAPTNKLVFLLSSSESEDEVYGETSSWSVSTTIFQVTLDELLELPVK